MQSPKSSDGGATKAARTSSMKPSAELPALAPQTHPEELEVETTEATPEFSLIEAEGGAPAGYRRLNFKLTGVSGLVMHNAQLANPLNRFTKALKGISSKRKKTDADFEEMARIEFLGGLYVGEDGPCIPGELIEAVIVQAAKKVKRGMEARAGVISDGNHRLEYKGPRDPDELWEDENFRLVAGVRVQQSRIMRTRPIFRTWSANVHIDFMPDVLNHRDIEEMLRTAGAVVGLGDWRPKFGRFTAERL